MSTRRRPEPASGWPSATAPPLTLTRSRSSSSAVGRGEHDAREGLVDLPQVDVGGRRPWRASSFALASAGRRCSVESGPATTARPTTSARGSGARSALVITAAAAPSDTWEALPAVIVPSAREGGREAPRASRSSSRGRPRREQVADRHDLLGQPRRARPRPGVRARREAVLRLARDPEPRVLGVRHPAHPRVGDRAVQAVVDHHVDHRHVAHRRPGRSRIACGARVIESKPPTSTVVASPGADHRRRHRHRAHARQADVVERDPGHLARARRPAAPRGGPGSGRSPPAARSPRRRSRAPASVRASAARTACAPSSTASTFASAPLNSPIGVRAPAAITTRSSTGGMVAIYEAPAETHETDALLAS